MGVPKFFRYISERYPNLSELIGTKEMSEFDNLYLDMNGIFHNCSHPDDSNIHFRITEQQIFEDICHYIDTILRLIQPQKLFFMAVDGVAPRAKMNQQRSRRFRSAKDANDLIEKAKAKGEVLPTENRFDSNCITPGTPFMARLQDAMKHFIKKKISSDPCWQNCRVILSGHETPGEGEHKIMEYIRFLKSKPDYDPNTRHCLYGLDADLIMLGLCTHERQFSLLREEVKFGKKAKRATSVDDTRFFLLHLGLLREYLALEFAAIKDKVKFGFEIERIIDDWVLMCFMVGNDFIPNLPNLHINSNALPILYKTYMEVLPTLDGYMNEYGQLNLKRLEKFMAKLAEVDRELFREHYSDIKEFEANHKNFETFGDDINTDTKNDLDALIKATQMEFGSSDETDSSDGEDAESDFVPEDNDESDSKTPGETSDDNESDLSDDELFEREFKLHKRNYYITKLKYPEMTEEVLAEQAACYITALQWTISYYYRGVCSWGWFYPHHYAPFISDIRNFQHLQIHLEKGKPFLPFEQLLSVLPADSKDHLPRAYHKLMTHPSSKLIEYFPRSFETDLNGKKQEWEAVVLIPFIDEDKLIDAMNDCNGDLTDVERKRNIHGPMLQYDFTSKHQGSLPDSPYGQAGTANLFCIETPVYRDDIQVPEDRMVFGPCKGAAGIEVYFPGFPTFRHHRHSAVLRMERVKVFDQPSRNESMIIQIDEVPPERTLENLAEYYMNREIFVGWPHLREAKVVGVSDTKNRIGSNEMNENYEAQFHHHSKQIRDHHLVRMGIDLGEINQLLHVVTLLNREYIHTKDERFTLSKKWSPTELTVSLNTIVENVKIFQKDLEKFRSIESVFTKDSTVFMLNDIYYGSQGKIVDPTVTNGRLKVSVQVHPQPNFSHAIKAEDYASTYTNSYQAASSIGMDTRTFNLVTGNVFIVTGEKRFPLPYNANKSNIGLKLKSLKHNEQVGGYTRTVGKQWLYSQKASDLVAAYHERFPKLFVLLRMKPNPNDFIFESELNEGRTENSPSMLREINEWLKEQAHNNAPRQNIGSDSLENETIKSIVDAVENLKSSPYRSMRLQVKPYLLYKPNLNDISVQPDSRADFRIFDRIVVARDGYIVPLGLRGTIIAVHPHMDENPLRLENVNAVEYSYEILFDEQFPAGQSIGEIAVKRVYNVRQSVLINISYGLRRAAGQQKVEKPRAAQQSTNVERNDWRNPNENKPQRKMDANIWPNLNINGKGANNKYDASRKPILLKKEEEIKVNLMQKDSNKDDKSKPYKNEQNQRKNIDLNNIPLPKPLIEMKISYDPSLIDQNYVKPFVQSSEDSCDALRRMLRISSQTDSVPNAPKLPESQPIDLNKLFGKPLPSPDAAPLKVETTMLPKPPLDWHKPKESAKPHPRWATKPNVNVQRHNNHHQQQHHHPSIPPPPQHQQQQQILGQPLQYNPLNQFIQNQMNLPIEMHLRPQFPGPMPFMPNNLGLQRMPLPPQSQPQLQPQQPQPQQHQQHQQQQHNYHQYRGMTPFSQSNVRVVGPIAANFQSNPNHSQQQINRSGPRGPQTLNNSNRIGHGAFIPLQAARKSAKPANKPNNVENQSNISVLKKEAQNSQPSASVDQPNSNGKELNKNPDSSKKSAEIKPKKSNPKPTANRPKRLACNFDLAPA